VGLKETVFFFEIGRDIYI